MTFVSIFLAILIERFVSDLDSWRPAQTYRDFLAWVRDRVSGSAFFDGWPGALVLLVPGMLAVGVILDMLHGDGVLGGFLSIAFSAAVLVWCFSAQPVLNAVERFLERYDLGDEDGARAELREMVGDAAPDDAMHWPGVAISALFAHGVGRFFGPLFWFAVLGPVGAVAFKTAAMLREQLADEGDESGLLSGVELVYSVLSWIPTRLQVLAAALVGAFESALEGWRAADIRCHGRFGGDDEALSVCAGYGALGLSPDWLHGEDDPPLDTRSLRAARGLVLRSVVVWLIALIMLSMLGVAV